MRVFKNAWFDRFARKQGLSDKALWEAVEQAECGLIDPQHLAEDFFGVLAQAWRRLRWQPGQGVEVQRRSRCENRPHAGLLELAEHRIRLAALGIVLDQLRQRLVAAPAHAVVVEHPAADQRRVDR